MITRSRMLKSDVIHYHKHNNIPATGPIYGPSVVDTDYVFRDWQITSSEGHPISQLRSGKDVGGPFYTKKWEHVASYPKEVTITSGSSSITTTTSGPVLAAIAGTGTSIPSASGGYPANLPDTPVSTLDAFGTTAIARTIPTNPIADTAQFIGELREGLPAIPGKALLKAKLNPVELGGEYLNYSFGIKPIISDYKKYAKAIKESDKILRQLERDSGRNVRRKYVLSEGTTSSFTEKPATYPIVGAASSAGTGTLVTEIEDYSKVYFEGAYTYYLPPQGTVGRWLAEANKLYGIRPSISTLYELAPWSWAADWFGNMGDVLHNLSAFQNDSLVLRYGYLMEHRIRTVTYTIDGLYNSRTGVVKVPAKQIFRCETKRRVQATPYGFGLQFDGFNPFQLSIIASLGLSRLK